MSKPAGGIGPSHLDHAKSTKFDLIVVGGGITGCWATLLAAQRGLKVCLVEAEDFGSSTSRVSHRILHGGFRYLQKMDLLRLRESVAERRHYFREFPDLVAPLPCLMPLYGDGLKSPLPFRTAALAYAALATGQNTGVNPNLRLPLGGVISKTRTQEIFSAVRTDGLLGGGVWHDGIMRSHPRIIMAILRRAAALGAICLNHAPATELLLTNDKACGVRVTHGSVHADLHAPAVLNTTGAAAGRWIVGTAIRPSPIVAAALAFNLVLDRPPVSAYGVAVEPPKQAPADQPRTYFLVPRSGRIAVGTTHEPADPEQNQPEVTTPMVLAMLADLNAAIPGLDLSPSDVLRVDAGLVPTDSTGKSEPSDRPAVLDHAISGGPAGLVSAIAVKYTTARHTASRGLQLAYGPHSAGRGLWPQVSPELPLALLLNSEPTADTPLDHPDAIKALCDAEGVDSLTDLVLGRSEWGEIPAHAMDLAQPLAGLLAAHLGWDPQRKQAELESLAHALPGSMPKMG